MSEDTLDQEVDNLISGISPKEEEPPISNLFSLDMGFKTPPVYSGAELKASRLAADQILPEDTATARAGKTLARVGLGTPAERQRDAEAVNMLDFAEESQIKKAMTKDFLGFTKKQRQRLDTLGDDYVLGVDQKGRDLTIMRLRMGRYFQRSILESIIKSNTRPGDTDRYKPSQREIEQATAEARALSTEFPDDPKYTRALTDLYAGAKLMVIDLPLHAAASTSYVGQELVGKGVPRVAGNIRMMLDGIAGLSKSKWAEKQTEKEFSNFIKWNVDAAENFYSGKWGVIDGFNMQGITNARVRPFVYNTFFANDLELTPQTAAMVFNLDNPAAGFYSHLLHIAATTVAPTSTISIARNLLMRGVGKRFKEFAADSSKHSARLNAKGESQAINLDIVKGRGAPNAQEIKTLTREFLEFEARTAGAFSRGDGKVRSIIDDIKTGRIELSQRQIVQKDLVRQEKLSRKDPAAANLGGKTLTETLKNRMKKAQAKQEQVYISPTSTLQARKEIDDEIRDIAFEQNLLGMGYGRNLQPTVRLLRNPQLRDEAKVEAAFSFGATAGNEIMKTERADDTGFKSAAWYYQMGSGFLAAMTLGRIVPARLAQVSSFTREFAMNAEVMLRNKGILTRMIEGTDIARKKLSPEEEVKRLGSLRMQAYNHWFSPQAQLRLDMAGGPGILREAELARSLTGSGEETRRSKVRRGVARMTPEVVKTPYLTNRALRYSHIDKDGEWVKLSKDQQDAMLNIADSIILSGRRVEILEVTQDSIEMDQAIRDLGGDPRKFNNLLARVLPMMGLMVFEETSDKVVSGMAGGLRVGKLAESINEISQHSDFLKEVDVVIDNLFPAGVDAAARSQLVGEIVASTKKMAGLYKNKIATDITNAISELKSIQRAALQNPGDFVVKGEPANGMFNRIDDVNQEIARLEKTLRNLEKDTGVLPDAPGVIAGREAAQQTVESGEKVSASADDIDVAFADLGEKAKQVRTTEEQAVGAMPGSSYTNGVDISLEAGDVGNAILDLALRTQRAYRQNYKKLYDDFFDALDDDPNAVQAIDDIGFVDRLMRSYYTRVTGEKLEGENSIAAIARGMKENRTGSVELRKFFAQIEKASREEFDRIFKKLPEKEQLQIQKLLSDPASDKTMRETMAALEENGFNVKNGLNNYLALNIVLGEKLPWTFSTLNDFRLQANSLGHSLNDDALKDLGEQMRIAMETAMGEAGTKRFKEINEGYRVDIGERFDRSELGKRVARSIHLMGKEGEDVVIELEEFFDLNKNLFGNEADSKAFTDAVRNYFGGVKIAGRSPSEVTGPVRTRYGVDLTTKLTNEADGSVVNIGEDLQKIIATLHHSALLKSKVFKGIDYDIEGWTTNKDVRARLLAHISGYDDNAAAAIESGARTKLFSDADGNNSILAGLGDTEYQASLLKLVEDSRALRGQLQEFAASVGKMADSIRPRLDAIENLAARVVNATVQKDIADSPIQTTADFFNALNRGIDDIRTGSVDDYIENLSKEIGASVEEVKQSLFSLFMQHAANHARGVVETTQGQTKVMDAQRVVDSFTPQAMEELFEANKNLLEKIIPSGITVNKLNEKGVMEPVRLSPDDYMEEVMRFARLLRVYSQGQGATAPKNIHAHAVKSLSPSSIISRIYAVNRGVVSSKYVITEAGLIYFRKKKAAEMAAILKNPDLMYHMNKILETRNVLPQAENKAFVGALKRAIIHAEGEEIDPASTEDTFLEKLKRRKQTEGAKLTMEDDRRAGPPYMYPENYDR